MSTAKIWEEVVAIPTYEVGKPDKNPMFLEKRVYQGSSGKVYPYPTIEKISREKTEKKYKAVFLENDYIKIMILPELGGRIQRAYDKTNGYDFIYYNHVIKPALVGLLGPWISGGIEFNWPQHHRPTTFMPTDYLIQENADGSKTLLINDVDQMYGTKGIAAFTLYPNKAYIEIKGQLYNRTSLPQTFLWWANPAVSVNDYTQSIFPPDVHFVMDHGKRDVSRFPIADGIYYKHDYSEGVDISRYKNIPVPTSYMAEKSDYDFVGGYDYQKEAGILHIADHHISPGKKQWTWGCGDFGKAWDRNLTDEDGPYIELMTGVYTDNQPDFTWLKPFEEKAFKQYFMPYKKVGQVKNASINAILNLEVHETTTDICVYATEKFENAEIIIYNKGEVIFRENTCISPVNIFEKTIAVKVNKKSDIRASVYAEEKLLIDYQPGEEQIPEMAKPAEAAKDPEEIMTNEELLLTGLHIEQYRHATYLPDPYYLEGLRRDKGDIRINNAYGLLQLRRGCFKDAEEHFRQAIRRLTWKNPNPYDSEAYYNLGLSLFYLKRYEEAYDAFYKATWSNEQQEMSFYYLAAISAGRGDFGEALCFVDKALIKNSHNIKARGLRAVLLRKLNAFEEADKQIIENLEVDPFDYISRFERSFLNREDGKNLLETNMIMRGFRENYLQVARDYAECSFLEEAVYVLEQCTDKYPLLYYYKAYYLNLLGDKGKAKENICQADKCNPEYCFPNKLEDIAVLNFAIDLFPEGAKAYYYLGNLFYDKLQYSVAINLWEESINMDAYYPTVHRNLALAYYNKKNAVAAARKELEKAFELDESDARVFFELDQLYKKIGMTFEKRFENYEDHPELYRERDDALIEYITLCNQLGMHEKAYETIMSHVFGPWEGAEGKVTAQYKIALLEIAKQKIKEGNYTEAETLLEKALIYPINLGEGKLEGTKDNNIYYYLGIIKRKLGKEEEAINNFQLAEIGDNSPSGVMYYNDQPADMIFYKGLAKGELGKTEEANSCFYKLLNYGKQHLNDNMRIDYFAVSLPDFLIFNDDLNIKNKAHCYYLMGLANLGFENKEEAARMFEKALEYDYNHQNSRIYLKMTH